MTLNDGTEIVHSEMKPDGRVKIYIEKPVPGGFHDATCYLPKCTWENIHGFTEDEMVYFKKLVDAKSAEILQKMI